MASGDRAVNWIYVSGRCARCHKYYELPRQAGEADAYFTVIDGTTAVQIICSNSILCGERRTVCLAEMGM